MLTLAVENGSVFGTAIAELTIARAYSRLGDYENSYHSARRAKDLSDRFVNPGHKAEAIAVLTVASVQTGRIREAEQEFAALGDLLAKDDEPELQYVLAELQGLLAIARGETKAALDARHAQEIWRQKRDRLDIERQTKTLREYHEVETRDMELMLIKKEADFRARSLEHDAVRIFWQTVAIVCALVTIIALAVLCNALIRRSKLLRIAAETDALTRISSRGAILAQAKSVCESARLARREVAMCMIDVDNFKRFNDSFGHALGDVVLKHCAITMRQVIRDVDAVGRLGGDEFLIVMEGVSENQATVTAQRILDAVAQQALPTSVAGHYETVKLTAGVVARSPHAIGLDGELIQQADEALLAAKAKGKNCVVAHSTVVAARSAHKRSVSGDARNSPVAFSSRELSTQST